MAAFNLKINGEKMTVDVAPDTPVLWVLRDHLNLVGTKYGCGIAQCGACTIHLGGIAMRSCILPVSVIGDQAVTTIEGLSEDGDHPLQQHDVVVEVFDNTAVLWNRITLVAHVRGDDVSNEFTVTEIYKKSEEGWKLLDLTFSSVRDTHIIEH